HLEKRLASFTTAPADKTNQPVAAIAREHRRVAVVALRRGDESSARRGYADERDGEGEGEAGGEAGALRLSGRQRASRLGRDSEPGAGPLHAELPVLHLSTERVASDSRGLHPVRLHPQVTPSARARENARRAAWAAVGIAPGTHEPRRRLGWRQGVPGAPY